MVLRCLQIKGKTWSTLFENPDFMTLHSNHFISRHGSDDDHRTFLLTLTPAPALYNCEFYLLGNPLKLNLPSPFQRPCSFVSILGSTSVNGIFCLKTNSWRWISMNGRIDLDHWMYTGSFDGHEVYVDGTCHWLFTKDDSKEQHTVVTLLSFDLSNQAFITTPIGEESITPHTYNRRLAVLNASIALLSNYDDNIVFHISILGQLGVTESWTKLYICGPLPSLEWPPYGFGKMGYMFFEKTDGELAYVDLSTQKIEEVDITTRSACLFTVGLYKKSLLSIRGSSK
ncbi:uncharacterized protein LOC131628412 isoform X1 [Vicia villosa]|uniref:uncharacterized protein LOC131628412 isoform X1 n=1 Tax=Vicia villosa TaxID=3911 RepID=UPI00273CB7F2|nr:uncharacterized protein LOC131628412 isoform X1 [Vicia villosa]